MPQNPKKVRQVKKSQWTNKEEWKEWRLEREKKAKERIRQQALGKKNEKSSLEKYKAEIKSLIENSIKTISYLSFVIAIGLSIIVAVVISINKNLTWEQILALVLSIFFAVCIFYTWIILLVWILYHRNINGERYHWKVVDYRYKKEWKEVKKWE